MSLDVYLKLVETVRPSGSGIFVREDGSSKEISREEWGDRYPNREPVIAVHGEVTNTVYHSNITHNLNSMADAAGIYNCLWHPEKFGFTLASHLIEPLTQGLAELKADPERFKEFNPSNGWGDYEGLVSFVEAYLNACSETPTATVEVSR